MCTDFKIDSPRFVGGSIRPLGFKSQNEFLETFTKHYMLVAAKDSFAFIFCGFSQQYPLSVLLESQADCKVTPCYIDRGVLPQQIRREKTTGPVNEVELALFVRRGKPNWAKFGIIKLIIGSQKYLGNLFTEEWPAYNPSHPFNKPPGLYDQIVKKFSEPHHHILEAFAGTCPSVYSALKRGRCLTLVEKSPDMAQLFEVAWEKANLALIPKDGKSSASLSKEDLVLDEAVESANEGSGVEAQGQENTPNAAESGDDRAEEDDSLGEQESDRDFETPMPDSDTEYDPTQKQSSHTQQMLTQPMLSEPARDPFDSDEMDQEQCSSTAYPPIQPKSPVPEATAASTEILTNKRKPKASLMSISKRKK